VKVRLAIIGSGFGLYGLLPAFQRLRQCEVVGYCARPTPRALEYCRGTGVEALFTDWRRMIKEVQPDAVAIAVVPKYQYAIARYALRHGVAVFAEKPLATSVKQARELLELARRSQCAHMVDFIFPEVPAWRAARAALRAGRIGRITQVVVNWSFLSHDLRHRLRTWKTDPARGGGALAFFGCHLLHNLEFFLGPIERLGCRLDGAGTGGSVGETAVNLQVKFRQGASGSVVLNCASRGASTHRWEFYGERGTMVLSSDAEGVSPDFRVTLGTEGNSARKLSVPKMPRRAGVDGRVPLVERIGQRFIRWCGDGGVAEPNFAHGCRVQELIEIARRSHRRGEILTVPEMRTGAARCEAFPRRDIFRNRVRDEQTLAAFSSKESH
jgi:predicted dehydrogenase